MPTKPPQVALGYFVRFMIAYGDASQQARDQLRTEEHYWELGQITDQEYVQNVSLLLKIDPPALIT